MSLLDLFSRKSREQIRENDEWRDRIAEIHVRSVCRAYGRTPDLKKDPSLQYFRHGLPMSRTYPPMPNVKPPRGVMGNREPQRLDIFEVIRSAGAMHDTLRFYDCRCESANGSVTRECPRCKSLRVWKALDAESILPTTMVGSRAGDGDDKG